MLAIRLQNSINLYLLKLSMFTKVKYFKPKENENDDTFGFHLNFK